MHKFLSTFVSIIVLLFFLSAKPVYVSSEKKQEYIFIQNLTPLVIYNKFQQTLSPDDKAKLGAFTPFRILGKNEILGDNFTHCMRVEYYSNEYFMLLETDGSISGINTSGIVKRIQGIGCLPDTLEVIAPNYFLTNTTGTKAEIKSGTKLIPFIEIDGKYYVKSLSDEIFGLIELPQADKDTKWFYTKTRIIRSDFKSIDPHEIVTMRVNDINDLIGKYYEYFGRESNRNIPAPKFEIKKDKQSIRISFVKEKGAKKYPDLLRESVRDINNNLTGTLAHAEIIEDNIVINIK